MLLKVQGLNKSFSTELFRPSRHVLKDVSFSLQAGATTGFIGINGSGKTTSLKCILGFIFPDSGTVSFNNGKETIEQFRSKLGYLPERPYYYDFLNVEEFLQFHWDLSGGGPGFQERKTQVLERVDLSKTGTKKLRQFSKGMLQRAGLAQALLRKPELMILDEPMSGLDPDGRILVKDILLEEKKRGTTLFFSSHLLSDMEELCDRLVVIDDGVILFDGLQTDLKQAESNQNLERAFSQLRTRRLREKAT